MQNAECKVQSALDHCKMQIANCKSQIGATPILSVAARPQVRRDTEGRVATIQFGFCNLPRSALSSISFLRHVGQMHSCLSLLGTATRCGRSAHQHFPHGLQAKLVPHREQVKVEGPSVMTFETSTCSAPAGQPDPARDRRGFPFARARVPARARVLPPLLNRALHTAPAVLPSPRPAHR
jgi:hypothetical protein